MGSFGKVYLILILTLWGFICVLPQEVCVYMKNCPVVYDLLGKADGQAQIEKLICDWHPRYSKVWCKIPCVTNSSGKGFCTLRDDCPNMTTRKDNISDHTNTCDIRAMLPQVYVCCPISEPIINTQEPIPDPTINPTTDSSPVSIRNLTPGTMPDNTPDTTPDPITDPTSNPTPDPTTNLIETTETLDTTTAFGMNIDSRNSQPDSEICGIQSDVNKIANGKVASMYDHPWSTLLQYSEHGKVYYKCGGTLISSKFVVTAAHCVHNTRLKLENVILGEYNVSSEVDCFLGQCMPMALVLGIKNVIIHPDWLRAERSFYDDIALIELQDEVTYNEFVRPICLSSASLEPSGQLTVAGWGKTEFGKLSDVKRIANLNIQPKLACLNTVRLPLKESQLCVGGGKADSCGGDSGGPLMEVDYSGFQPIWRLVGVVSLGSGKCGSIGKPAIYTNASYYYEWILENIT